MAFMFKLPNTTKIQNSVFSDYIKELTLCLKECFNVGDMESTVVFLLECQKFDSNYSSSHSNHKPMSIPTIRQKILPFYKEQDDQDVLDMNAKIAAAQLQLISSWK